MKREKIIIIDFGSQFSQLIARRIRENNVYSEIYSCYKKFDLTEDIKGIILSGSPASIYDKNFPELDLDKIINSNIPILAICYGAQLIAHKYGGKVERGLKREYGKSNFIVKDNETFLFKNVLKKSIVWMSHSDHIHQLPKDYKIIGSTDVVEIAAFQNENIFCLQFHPEVFHTQEGGKIINNFIKIICKCNNEWKYDSIIEESITQIKNKVGNSNVILGLSGGVDSTVTAVLIHKAIGKQLHCIIINNGLTRSNEFDSIHKIGNELGLNIIEVNYSKIFIDNLNGVEDPEKKRKIIGKLFIESFENEAKKIKNVEFLAQGTIYPDVIESGPVKGPSSVIKSHHNVGGLPKNMNFKLIEPLNKFFKDEVREVGKLLEIPDEILNRHPFPGPGLAIRIIGEINEDKLKILKDADEIFINELKKRKLYSEIWQAGAILLPIKSVGVMGDERTYENVLALRAVTSTDGMTAEWAKIPFEHLEDISNIIINNIKGINRVVYDISSKPPSTIEWE